MMMLLDLWRLDLAGFRNEFLSGFRKHAFKIFREFGGDAVVDDAFRHVKRCFAHLVPWRKRAAFFRALRT